MKRWGEDVGREVARPVVFALRGDLGAGKSVLARAIARGAGVDSPMPSPTFNLLFQYQARGTTVNHLDLYRLEQPSEVWELGWRELGEDGQIVLIEWPEHAETLLHSPRWDIWLEAHPDDARLRNISLAAVGAAPPIPFPDPQ